jgi:hypothetical protein
MSRDVIWMDVRYGDYKKLPELDVAQIAEVDDDDSNTEVDEVNLAGTPRKMLESVIFGTLFLENVSCQIP